MAGTNSGWRAPMPVTSWLLTLDPGHEAPALVRLHGDLRFAVDEPVGIYLPLVADADSGLLSLEHELRALPGIVDVVLVHAHFADVDVGHGAHLGRRPQRPSPQKLP